MGIFPFFTDEGEIEENTVEEDLKPYREYEINDNGKLTGKIVEGTAAIAMWCKLALKSTRYKHSIYSWDYGEEFSSMLGNSYEPDLLKSETERMIKECLLINEHIEDIKDLSVSQVKDKLYVKFTVVTDQGDTEVDAYV